jgi:hypothetical protein
MPYTTSVPGTTITASWANANVRDQVITPFASVSARDSAITSPVNGMMAVTTDTGYLWRHNGTKWLLQPTTIHKTGDTSWTSTTTLTDDPDLKFPVDANGTYEFEIVIGALTVSTSVGLKTTLTFPAGARLDYGREGLASSAAFDDWQQNATTSGSPTATWSTSANNATIRMNGTIFNGSTAGNLTVQAAQGTSNASSAWILRGSRIRYRQTG